MNREDYLKRLIKDQGYNFKEFANRINIPYTTLMTMLNRSIGGAAIDNVIKVCNGLGISIADLQDNDSTDKIYPTEKSMLQKYRALDEHGKEVTDYILNSEYARCASSQEIKEERSAVSESQEELRESSDGFWRPTYEEALKLVVDKIPASEK